MCADIFGSLFFHFLLFIDTWNKRMLESEWIATAWPMHVLLGLVLRLRAVLGLCVLRLRAVRAREREKTSTTRKTGPSYEQDIERKEIEYLTQIESEHHKMEAFHHDEEQQPPPPLKLMKRSRHVAAQPSSSIYAPFL
jgi:hypothetical protein